MNLVSVIIPTYSRPTNLCRAIESVLNQTYPNIEIIVVDDNGQGTPCQEETERLLENFIKKGDIRYIIHDVNRNGSAARNTGFDASHGEFVNYLDDDDIPLPTKIEQQVNRLEESPDYDACYCNTFVRGKRRDYITRCCMEGNLTFEYLTGRILFNTSTILFRRQAIIGLEGWDVRFLRHQDWEIMVRFFRKHKIAVAASSTYLLEKTYVVGEGNRKPEKMVEYRHFFLKEMADDIHRTGREREVLRWQIENLSLSLMASGAKRLGRHYFYEIFRYGWPSMEAWGKYMYYLVTS